MRVHYQNRNLASDIAHVLKCELPERDLTLYYIYLKKTKKYTCAPHVLYSPMIGEILPRTLHMS